MECQRPLVPKKNVGGQPPFPPLRTNLNYLPAVKIAGANFDSSAGEMTERRGGQHLPCFPTTCDSKARAGGGDEVGGLVTSGRVIREGAAPAEPSALADRDTTPHVVRTSGEISSSESSDDDGEDFLDLLVDTLAGDFDPDLFI